MSILKKISPATFIAYIVKVYLLGILSFTLFRIASFIVNASSLASVPTNEQASLITKSLLVGFRFDTVISMYLLALPLLLLFIHSLFFKNSASGVAAIKWGINILFIVALFICSADIPFFHHFNYRINSAALMWADSFGVATSMISQDIAYWGVLIPFSFLVILFLRLNTSFARQLINNTSKNNKWIKTSAWFVLAGGVCFLALRGTTNFSRSPLNAKDAYFSNYSIINQAALNPVYTLLKSFIEQQKASNTEINLMDHDLAFELVRAQFNRNYVDTLSLTTLKKPDNTDSIKPNIVLVLMEGLSANRLEAFGDTINSTPFINSLIKQSYFYSNAYCSGIHTHNGIFSSLTSLPAIFDRHALTQIPILRYNNLIGSLKNNGYKTMYVTNHDVEFDNVGGFLVENGVEQMLSEKEYDLSKKLGVWGVPDDYMFDISIPYINKLAENKNPFLTVYMTTSNHRPFRFPSNYKRRFTFDEDEGPAYADWSIEQFMKQAKQQSWFENTIFVFMSDHGWPMQVKYDIPLSYMHVPLFFYSPKYFPTPVVNNKLASQLDLFPTIMSAAKQAYAQTAMGIDLFNENRPFVYFNADDKVGVMNEKYLFIYRKNGPETLHELPSVENCIAENKEIAQQMKNYAFAQMQVTFEMIQKNKVSAPTE